MNAYELPLFKLPAIHAGVDLTGSLGLAVKLNAQGAAVVAGANDQIIGILQDKPALNQPCEIWHLGVARCVAGAAIAMNALLTTDASGRVVTATTGQKVLGQAMTTGSAAGSFVSVLLLPFSVAP